MTALSRLAKLEEKLKPDAKKIYWVMWKGCKWKVCDGIYRNTSESISDFKKRVLKATNKKYLWVK